MKRLRPLVLAVVVLVLTVLGIRFVAQRRPPPDTLGSGLVETDEVQVSAKIGGRVGQVLVDEGDTVRKGRLIAVLEHADIDAEIERARGAVQSADGALRDMERGSRTEQIEAARARVAQARAGSAGARRQLRTAQENWGKVTDLKQGADAAQARVRLSEAGVLSAQAKLDQVRNGPTGEEIETLRAALRQAEARVETARVAAQNAEQVYDHQVAIEGPMIAAATEESAGQASTGLADTELGRTQVLARSDAATARTVDQARAQRDIAAARLAGARRAVTDAAEQVATTRAQARQLLDGARNTLQEAIRSRDTAQAHLAVALAGTREELLRAAQAGLESALAEREGAKAALANATQSYQDRLLARQQRDSAQTALDTARALERAAQAELSLLLAGHTAEAIQVARGRLSEARAALQAAEVRRGYCSVYAPRTGTITETVAEEGETVAAGAPVVVLSDLENLRLRAYVSFRNLGRLTIGQAVRVTTQAVPNRTFEGKVIRVAEEAEFTPKDVQTPEQRTTQVYWVKVWLGDGGGLLKPGMPADLRTAGDG